MENSSRFEGSVWGYIGYWILIFVVTICTLGLAAPFPYNKYFQWKAKNTVIDGKRLVYEGTVKDLYLYGLLWIFLTIITIGIFAYILPYYEWKFLIARSHFEED